MRTWNTTLTAPAFDHVGYKQRVRRMSDAELRGIIADCEETLDLQPDSPNAGRYLDEQLYAAEELLRRLKRAR
jgi:hypothetical protein